ncbi:hypothetical protein KZX46_03575 (plasmid) [Polymorphobacter sp. PAMC 29334]|uniref:hypothetical protein n=1 Tax=Polymorphobacter sp. PAMC 29334 TaxID=2862331 RepID=UPI001C7920D2|nr:hypothetical protein [Polymorphobacter sp. PAMC 29334]QYE33201.1 hypothetical protein KZX46_03575 [Polymorphobacter sp. PAMC 29334]
MIDIEASMYYIACLAPPFTVFVLIDRWRPRVSKWLVALFSVAIFAFFVWVGIKIDEMPVAKDGDVYAFDKGR